MPRRFLSVRGRKNEAKDLVIDPPEYFDFDFRSPVTQTNGQSPVTSPVSTVEMPKRQKKVQDTSLRPWTSDADGMPDKRVREMKLQDHWIGVAIGSPTHPPHGWQSLHPLSTQQNGHGDGSLSPSSPSKWQQLGGMFKPKSPLSNKQLPPSPDTVTPERTDSGDSMPRNRWRNQKESSPSSLDQAEARNPHKYGQNVSRDNSPRSTSSPSIPLPKLELDIPNLQFDRYSVMFRDVTECSVNQILAQRTQILVESESRQIPDKDELPPLPLAMSCKPWLNIENEDQSLSAINSRPTQDPKQIAHSSWSDLLPARNLDETSGIRTASSSSSSSSPLDKVQSNAQSQKVIYRKPVAVPAESIMIENLQSSLDTSSALQAQKRELLEAYTYVPYRPGLHVKSTSPQRSHPHVTDMPFSPISKHNTNAAIVSATEPQTPPSMKPSPLQPRRTPSTEFVTSPEEMDRVQIDNETPWIMGESPKSLTSSHTSIEDDIFFDIKPLRDSKGEVESQFVVTRPDSSAVQLARSISQRLKERKQQKSASAFSTATPQTVHEEWSLPPDIQAAEHFCLSPDNKSAQYALRESMFDRAIEEVEKLANLPLDVPALPARGLQQQPDTTKPSLAIPTRVQGLAIGIPSPIAERSCECTPNATPLNERCPSLPVLQHYDLEQISPSKSEPLDLPESVPPPVPKKDSRFLPRSKVAVRSETKQASVDLPVKPRTTRAVTDPTIHPPRKSSISGSRSASFSPQTKPGSPNRKMIESGIVAVAVKPAAEVSVARKISLSRKSSHEITVARSSSKRLHQTPVTGRPESEERINRTKLSTPVILEGEKSHKPGVSVNGLVEFA